MQTYFLIFHAAPEESSEHFGKIKGMYAHFWVKENSPENAINRAKHYLHQYQWRPVDLEQAPVETTLEQFQQKDIGLKHYRKAQQHGLAAVFYGWPEDHQESGMVLPL